MKTERFTDTEAEAWMDTLDKSFTPGSEEVAARIGESPHEAYLGMPPVNDSHHHAPDKGSK